MKFGIFFEMSTPRPFTGGIERQVYDNALEQARLADELGFDTVWAAEQCEYSSRKWCSTAHTVSKPSSSASRHCSSALR